MILSFTPLTSFSTITSNLTEDFARVAAWLKVNQLIVNVRKEDRTHAVWDVAIDKKNKTLDVAHHQRTLPETNLYKYLGVQLYQNLNIKDLEVEHNTTN